MGGCDPKVKSEVEIMWTNQHGTGPKTDDRVETQVILQYMCRAYPEGKMATNDVNSEFEYHTIRNGQRLNTQRFVNGGRENTYIRKDFGLHEPANYYQAYIRRERNKGEGTMKYGLLEKVKLGFYKTKTLSVNATTSPFPTKIRHVNGFDLVVFELLLKINNGRWSWRT